MTSVVDSLFLLAFSDTHLMHKEVEEWLEVNGAPHVWDVFVFAGDATPMGRHFEVQPFLLWLNKMQKKYQVDIVFIAGNHDFLFERESALAEQMIKDLNNPRIHYLNDSGVEIEGVKFWGSPITPWFHDWAFNRERGPEIREHWDLIPKDTDVLVTHGPPENILDGIPHRKYGFTQDYRYKEYDLGTEHVGCNELREAVLHEVKPQAHVFGHIHEAYGTEYHEGIQFINASSLDGNYRPLNDPIEFTVRRPKDE